MIGCSSVMKSDERSEVDELRLVLGESLVGPLSLL